MLNDKSFVHNVMLEPAHNIMLYLGVSHRVLIGKYLWLAPSSSGTNMAANLRLNTQLPQTLPPSSSDPHTWLTRTPSSSGNPTGYVRVRLRKALQHGAEENVCIKMAAYIVPTSATSYLARRSINLQEHVHTCIPSSHTLMALV